MAPVGSKLSLTQLVEAVHYKVSRCTKPSRLHKYSVSELNSMEQKLQITLSLIRSVRNFLQPINKLPPELLTIIFSQAQQHLPDFLPMSDAPSTWNWLSLGAVCRHWRGVIATSPCLWLAIDSGMLPERFLKRSSAVPLKIYLGLKMYDMSDEILQSIVSQSKRFRELHLDASSWESSSGPSNTIFHRFNSPAPILTSLTLMTEGRDIVNGALPPIFSGQMPSLRKLCLKHLTSWPRTYFQSLTHVCLYDQNEGTRPTMDDFLDFLQGSPLLEELALVRAGPTRLDITTQLQIPLSRIVSLPHLRQLEVGEWPSAPLVARFLSHIHLQPQTDMYFWGDHMLNTIHPESEDVASLDLLLPENISRLENLKGIKRWNLARQPRVINDASFVSITGNEQEGRTLYMYGTFSASQLIPARLLSRYPVSDVESLAARDSCTDSSSGNGLDVEFWKQIMEGLPALQKLEILAFRSTGHTRVVMGALSPSVGLEPSLPCPLLTSLTIEHDLNLPAYFIRTIAEARARFMPAATLKKLRVLVFEPNSHIAKQPHSRISSYDETSVSGDSNLDDADVRTENEFRTREEEEYRQHTEDDRKLLEECPESLGVIQFEYGVPLSVGIVPETWPTRAFQWTRDNPGRRGVA